MTAPESIHPHRIVIDLDLTDANDEGLLDGILADIGTVIGDNNYGPRDVIGSWDARIEDRREDVDIVVAGNPVDGFLFFGPVPAGLDGGEIADSGEFDLTDWVVGKLQPYPNPEWAPLPE